MHTSLICSIMFVFGVVVVVVVVVKLFVLICECYNLASVSNSELMENDREQIGDREREKATNYVPDMFVYLDPRGKRYSIYDMQNSDSNTAKWMKINKSSEIHTHRNAFDI